MRPRPRRGSAGPWRSLFEATEDRNYDDSTLDDINTELTVALRGDRRPGEGTP